MEELIIQIKGAGKFKLTIKGFRWIIPVALPKLVKDYLDYQWLLRLLLLFGLHLQSGLIA